jgi:mono/diheme cytochrome c family protein
MKKILKLIGKIIGVLVGLIVLAVVVVMAVGYFRYNKTYDIAVPPLEIPTDEASIARGRHLVDAVAHCAFCHGEGLAGQYIVNTSAEGIVVAPNLTPGEGGRGASFTTEDWVRAIRHGVHSEGRSVLIMPLLSFDTLSEADLAAIIAYLQTIPPMDNVLPETKPGPLMIALIGAGPFTEGMSALHIDHESTFPAAPAEGETAEYGAYLVEIGQCRLCHGAELAGGQSNPGAPLGPNLTPGGEPGFWTDEQFLDVIRTGMHPSGRELVSHMPWKYFRDMTDTELMAIRAYLMSLPKLETVIP